MRDALKTDRARVQLGRISAFGLLELSRQRLRPSLQELSTLACPACEGTGVVRSVESAALRALRGIEMEGLKNTAAAVALTLPEAVGLYVLNQKRNRLVHLEQLYGLRVDVQIDRHMNGDQLALVCTEQKAAPEAEAAVEATAATEAATDQTAEAAESTEDDGEGGGRKRRRRRRRSKRRPGDGEFEGRADRPLAADGSDAAEPGRVPRERPQRPARQEEPVAEPIQTESAQAEPVQLEAEATEEIEKRPRRRRRRSSRSAAAAETEATSDGAARVGNGADAARPRGDEHVEPEPHGIDSIAVAPPAPAPEPLAAAPLASGQDEDDDEDLVPAAAALDSEPQAAPKRGWWSRFTRKED
jgi:ribonuclease E